MLRIFAGSFAFAAALVFMIAGQRANQWMWVLAAVVMLVPITMLVLSLTISYPAIRWINVGASVFLVLFNLVGLPYPGLYDNFLIGVGFVFDGLTIWYAWTWV